MIDRGSWDRASSDVEGEEFYGCIVASLRWMPEIGFVTEQTHVETAEMAGGGRDRSQGLRLFFWVVVFLLAIYALSVGPVARIVRSKPGFPPRAILMLYEPLELLSRQSPVVGCFFDWYLYDVWKVHD